MILSHSSTTPSVVGTSKKVLSKILDRNTSLVLWERGMPNFVDSWLQNLRLESLHEKQFQVSEENLALFEDDLDRYIRKIGRTQIIDITNWLVSDISENVQDFIKHTGAEVISVKLRPNLKELIELAEYDGLVKLYCSYGLGSITWKECNNKARDQLPNMIMPLDIVLLKGKSWPGLLTSTCLIGRENPASDNNSLLLEIEYIN